MPNPADLLITNATIYTVDDFTPWASTMAIAQGTVQAVGDDTLPERYGGPDTDIRDMAGAFVMPGLVDVHNHHSLAGKSQLFELTFPETASVAQVLDTVADHAATLPPDAWIIGGSWGSTLVAQLRRDSARAALDRAAGGRPVILSDDSKHNRWVNSRTLELARIDASTPDPDSGEIVRDADTGEPTGLLLEAAGVTAEHAVTANGGGMSQQQQRLACATAITTLHRHGVTTFQDAGVSVDIMRSLAEMDGDGELCAWVVTSMLANDPIFGFEPVGEQLFVQGEKFRSTHHRPDFVKIFLDGVPPTRTAAFLEPYLSDEAHGECFHGAISIPTTELTMTLRSVAHAGLSAKVHCTGDASVRAVLDAVAVVRDEGYTGAMFQVAHGQFIHPTDRSRFADLGVTADISPFLWTPGVIPTAIAEVLPADRAGQMQPNRTLLDSGALVAGGTDWPVSPSPNIWEGIQGLVTRADPTGRHPGTLWEGQALTLAEAITVFTRNGAMAMGLGEVTGSLTPGKSADFVVLDRDPFDTPVDHLAGTTVRETWFAGRNVLTGVSGTRA